MPAPRKDFSFAVEWYAAGWSIQEVARACGVSRQSMWRVLQRRGVVMRQPLEQPVIVWRGRRFSLRSTGYYAETTGRREFLHRAVWSAANGPIPDGFDVHHVNGDKSNNELENLVALSKTEHGQAHGFAGNQYVPSLGLRPVK